ncbi:MAG: hypothetical protein JOY66_08820, partial [Acetobacteraceae bacterium]|nr:hypothetical protein [Acetobacteraceae bacterium]
AKGGTIAIGLGDGALPAIATVQAGGQVFDTGTELGAGPASSGTLVVTGAGTSWSDFTDPTQTQNTTGTMLVGVPDPGIGAGATVSSPASLVVSQGAVLTEAGYAEIGVGSGSAGAATVSAGARWQIGAGALSVGAGGSGTLAVLNGGTVAAGSGGSFLSGGTALAMPFGVTAGQSGSGAITVSGTGSVLLTPGALILGGGGAGALTTAAGGLAEAGSLQVWEGSRAEVDAGGAIDVGASGTAVAGAVLIEAGRTLLGNGLIAAGVVNNGTRAGDAGGARKPARHAGDHRQPLRHGHARLGRRRRGADRRQPRRWPIGAVFAWWGVAPADEPVLDDPLPAGGPQHRRQDQLTTLDPVPQRPGGRPAQHHIPDQDRHGCPVERGLRPGRQ